MYFTQIKNEFEKLLDQKEVEIDKMHKTLIQK